MLYLVLLLRGYYSIYYTWLCWYFDVFDWYTKYGLMNREMWYKMWWYCKPRLLKRYFEPILTRVYCNYHSCQDQEWEILEELYLVTLPKYYSGGIYTLLERKKEKPRKKYTFYFWHFYFHLQSTHYKSWRYLFFSHSANDYKLYIN